MWLKQPKCFYSAILSQGCMEPLIIYCALASADSSCRVHCVYSLQMRAIRCTRTLPALSTASASRIVLEMLLICLYFVRRCVGEGAMLMFQTPTVFLSSCVRKYRLLQGDIEGTASESALKPPAAPLFFLLVVSYY